MYKIPIQTSGTSVYTIGNTTIVNSSFTTQGGNAGVVESVNVTFPIKFKTTPCIFVTARSAAPYTQARNVTVASRKLTGFTGNVLRMDNNGERINYFAIGEKSR